MSEVDDDGRRPIEDDHLARRLRRARSFTRAGRWPEAAAVYMSLVGRPDTPADVKANAGVALFKAGRYRDSLVPLSEAVLAYPDDHKLVNRLALAVQHVHSQRDDAAGDRLSGRRLCEAICSDRFPSLYRAAIDQLMQGEGSRADRPFDDVDAEKLVALDFLLANLSFPLPQAEYETIDDILVRVLNDVPGDIVLIYSISNSGSDQVNETLADRKNRFNRSDVILAHHRFYSSNVRREAGKIHRSCAIKHILGMSGRLSRRIKVVTMIREPIARLFSSYMYSEMRVGEYAQLGAEEVRALDDATWDRIAAGFYRVVRSGAGEDFFANQIAKASGYSILAGGVDLQPGYAIVSQGQCDFLILRTEKMEACFPEASARLLGEAVDLLPMTDERVRRTRTRDMPIYQEARARLRLPPELFEAVYRNEWTRAAFTPAEIEQARAAWCAPA
ncbi:hypothetical protein [Thalassobaculum fulvum]|nr:hypothetical protein [Thalassobaculum fulvum]